MSRLTEFRKDLNRYEYKQDERGYCFIQEGQIVQKLGKLEDLEDELGCPLEVVVKALKEGIYQADGGRRKYPTIEYNEATKKFFFSFGTYCNVEDYKKNWWLKENREE